MLEISKLRWEIHFSIISLFIVCFSADSFIVMCYNVLCDKYCTKTMYGYCPSWALKWEYRKKLIMNEILQHQGDILSLQVNTIESYISVVNVTTFSAGIVPTSYPGSYPRYGAGSGGKSLGTRLVLCRIVLSCMAIDQSNCVFRCSCYIKFVCPLLIQIGVLQQNICIFYSGGWNGTVLQFLSAWTPKTRLRRNIQCQV